MRVRTLDGQTRDKQDINKLRSQQLRMPHLDIVRASDVTTEFVICAEAEKHLDQVRAKLPGVGLEEVIGDTSVAVTAPLERPKSRSRQVGGGGHQRGPTQHGGNRGSSLTPETDKVNLKKKPYGFVAMPQEFTTSEPVWHDGTSSKDRFTGEIRFELKALTRLLVGWERGRVGDVENGDWHIEAMPDGQGQSMKLFGQWSFPVATNKSVLCPLRAPWGKRPVIIPGDSIKGLLRHELGALLGAPMERVAERSYSYRPNARFPNEPNARLVARLARIPEDGCELIPIDRAGGEEVRVPTCLELLPINLEYDGTRQMTSDYYRFDDSIGDPYRGGQGAGERLNSKRPLHRTINANYSGPTDSAAVPESVQDGYLATVRHLIDEVSGHFSQRHPDAKEHGENARVRILGAAKTLVFQPGDLIWVEWDTEKKCVVSLGWHYYYRWAYTDSIRKKGGKLERYGLFPLDEEKECDAAGAPVGLSPVRRLLGYTGDNDGSKSIGSGDHEQLMGRLFPNAAVEVVEKDANDATRFMKRTFLKELGMPRPSAVEHYLKQSTHPKSRPTDQARLATYGDARGYDEGGKLSGRKFYLDRSDADHPGSWKDDELENRMNDRSTLAIEASLPGRRFRFTLRFRDLDPTELSAVLVTLCPDQFKSIICGDREPHSEGYCSKLGYARPLGWGSVRIEAKSLFWLDEFAATPVLTSEADVSNWVVRNYKKTSMEKEWLDLHRRKHPDATDYPHMDGKVYAHHTTLRAEHSRARRYSHRNQP